MEVKICLEVIPDEEIPVMTSPTTKQGNAVVVEAEAQPPKMEEVGVPLGVEGLGAGMAVEVQRTLGAPHPRPFEPDELLSFHR